MSLTAFLYNDNVLEVCAKNGVTLEFINDANIVVTLTDESGDPVSGQMWPTAVIYVSASEGIYRATLSKDLNMERADRYTATVDIDGGPGLVAHMVCDVVAAERTCAGVTTCA